MSNVNLSLFTGPTGMEPTHISFFQALNIGTKVVKGQIELVADFPILKIGEKVTPSAAILLSKLAMKPFEYGMEVEMVYQDGSVFPAAVLDISDANDRQLRQQPSGSAHRAPRSTDPSKGRCRVPLPRT